MPAPLHLRIEGLLLRPDRPALRRLPDQAAAEPPAPSGLQGANLPGPRDNAPRSADHLCDECRDHWTRLQDYLTIMGIPYEVDHRLVRGLDYYTRTVFEVQPKDGGGQSTICGGGRYDGLIEELGGRPTPGIALRWE